MPNFAGADGLGLGDNVLSHRAGHRWIPLIWLPWISFYFAEPALAHASRVQWIETIATGIVFLVCFFAMFWDKPTRVWYYFTVILLLGVVCVSFNPGSAAFLIYAASFAPFLSRTEMGGIKLIALVVVIGALQTWIFHLDANYLIYGCAFPVFIGGGNVFYAQRNRANAKLRMAGEEIEHLAKVAERERIARDLHDVLGHTLSIIILKSELAGKLIDNDPARAKAEIADVEQTSRTALAEVRSTIRGYRTDTLETELKQAKAALETAGVSVRSEAEKVGLNAAQESIVALVLREAVTNIVRHAKARNCHVRLTPLNGTCLLEIQDDGQGGAQLEGSGIRGMRERVESLGGTFERKIGQGTTLVIQFPLAVNTSGAQ
ncbi:MAG TPA: sensor histidine kinase [Terriglobales bacterium]|jgi:two-component system sensor histidine kinase DesK